MVRSESIPVARRFPSVFLRYGLAVALVAAALGLTLLLQKVVTTTGYFFFYVAVGASTWFCGKWCGWLAVILSTLVIDYVFVPPFLTLATNRNTVLVFIEFAAFFSAIGWFSSWRKRVETALQHGRDELQMRVEERTSELQQTNERLLAEMAERRRAEDAYYEAQAQLARMTRMSALGALAASISHEVNQPLAAVVTNADACTMLLSSDPPNLEEARAAVDCIAQDGTRASEVIRHIRTLFTKDTLERKSVQVNQLIRDVGALLQAEASRNQVALQMELATDLAPARGDRVQLQQVIVNLVLNAIEAMSDVTDRPRRLVIRSERQNSDELLVAVRDSGVGIDAKDFKRIFDAFFTTKAQGMGMGLSICHSIIEAHGGRLWASANSDHGATLQFTLPADPETPS